MRQKSASLATVAMTLAGRIVEPLAGCAQPLADVVDQQRAIADADGEFNHASYAVGTSATAVAGASARRRGIFNARPAAINAMLPPARKAIW